MADDVHRRGRAEPGATGPFADVVFTVTTVLAAALLLLLPQVILGGHDTDDDPQAVAARLAAGGWDGLVIVANHGGATIVDAAAPARIATDAIRRDAGLRDRLAVAGARGERVILVVGEDGLEAGFHLEAAAGRAGLASVAVVRRP